jgi:DNA polymerase III subunit delta
MIVKHFDLKKKLKNNINFYLLYGQNTGLIEETIDEILKPNFSQNIHYYDEGEILSNTDEFKEKILNKSFFANDKLIIINRVSDKILHLIKEILLKKIEDIKFILKSDILEKKSKLRSFFEKDESTITVAYYEDNHQTLSFLANNFFKQRKIKISPQNINFIVERSKGNRISLKNELKKISSYSHKKLTINFEEIVKLTNLAENYNISELIDQCLAKNKKKTLNILNENNSSSEDNILILKTFLYKLKRLKKLKIELKINKNLEDVVSMYRPPIFWKEKDIIKQQLKIWSLTQIRKLIKNVNHLELLTKSNSYLSNKVLNDFIFEKLELPNN